VSRLDVDITRLRPRSPPVPGLFSSRTAKRFLTDCRQSKRDDADSGDTNRYFRGRRLVCAGRQIHTHRAGGDAFRVAPSRSDGGATLRLLFTLTASRWRARLGADDTDCRPGRRLPKPRRSDATLKKCSTFYRSGLIRFGCSSRSV